MRNVLNNGSFFRFMNFVHPAWQILFFIIPIALLVLISFWRVDNYTIETTFTLDNYREFFQKNSYHIALTNSLRLAMTILAITIIFALPIAKVIFDFGRRLRIFFIGLLLVPFFSSYIIRMFAWQIWLSDNGILRWLIGPSISSQLSVLYSETAVIIGLTSTLIPISSIMIFLSLANVNPDHIEAARNLGASNWQNFYHIQLPFAKPGIAAASLFSFITSFGDTICAGILGGNQTYYLSTAIQDRVKVSEWAMAAALSTVVLIISVIFFGVLFKLFYSSLRKVIND